MSVNSAVAGQRAAELQGYSGWLLLGTLLGPVAPFFAHVLMPTAPPGVLEAGPADPAEQHLFIDAYLGRAKNLRIRQAWIGLVFSFFFYTAACVGGCLTFMQTTFDYMARNPPNSTGRRPAGDVNPGPLVVREPGDPGPRPFGVWAGHGGSNPLDSASDWRDPRAAESWDVEITFGNNRIEVSYPMLGCTGELFPVSETAQRLEYGESLTCVSPRYVLAYRSGLTPTVLLQRTADDLLWFEWSRFPGPVRATASLRPLPG